MAIESKKDFKNTPKGQYERWTAEMEAAEKRLKKWKKQSDKIVKRFVDRKGTSETVDDSRFSLNLFFSNVTTLNSLLYGNLPTCDVDRKYADANDDIARVAAETMERLLNADIADNSHDYDSVLRSALLDRLLSGLGCARVRYEFDRVESEVIDELTGVAGVTESVTNERAPVEYYYWGDVLWGWCRSYADMPWLAYRSYMTKDEAEARFGDKAEKLTYKAQTPESQKENDSDPDLNSSWSKAEVWEIWDKTERKVIWLSKGYDKVLDTRDDPLQLSAFYPSPPFFIANQTTTLYIPTPDFHMAQDLYNEVDVLQSRISILTTAVKAVGVYDQSAEGIQRMFKEGSDNELIPVDNWALFAEKGGIAGSVQWVPLQDIVNAIGKLTELRNDAISLLQQITGMSDIMQGSLANQYEGVGQSQIKARFGSVRIQALQEEFASFASNLLQIKAEIIARHFEPETIAKQSNMQLSFDADKLPQAIMLIKKPEEARLRVKIRPESVAMIDFAELQAERTGFLTAISTFMQSAAPLIQQSEAATPFLLQLLQWGLAGFKGASQIEGVIDKAIEATIKETKNKQDKPNPEKEKLDMAMQLEQTKIQGQLQIIQTKTQSDMTVRQQDMQMDIQTAQAQSSAKLMEIQAALDATLAEISAKAAADSQLEILQTELNAQQIQIQQQGEMMKEHQKVIGEMKKEAFKQESELDKRATEAEISTRETLAQTKIAVAASEAEGNDNEQGE